MLTWNSAQGKKVKKGQFIISNQIAFHLFVILVAWS